MPRCMIQWREEHTWSVVEKREKDDDSHGPAVDWEWTRELTQKSTHLKGNCQLVCNPVGPWQRSQDFVIAFNAAQLTCKWTVGLVTTWHKDPLQPQQGVSDASFSSSRHLKLKMMKMKLHMSSFPYPKNPTDSAVMSVGFWWISLNSIKGVEEEICIQLSPHQKPLISSYRWYYGNVSSLKSLAGSQERRMFVRYCFDW